MTRLTSSGLALLCAITFSLPILAQDEPAPKEPPPPEPKPAAADTKPAATETKPVKSHFEDPPLHRWGGWTVSLAGWQPSMLEGDEEVANLYSSGVAEPLVQDTKATFQEILRATYHLPNDIGSILGQYEGMHEQNDSFNYQPGQFIFGESRAFPLYGGVYDNGLVDGYSSSALIRTKEFRLEFQKQAFDTKWAKAHWSLGYRELTHKRALGINYYSINSGLPPLIAPVVDNFDVIAALTPLPDTVSQSSDFEGHGLGASFDVEFPLPAHISIISGVSLGLVRGRVRSEYLSTTSYYALIGSPNVPLTSDELIAIMANPWPEGQLIDPNNPPAQPHSLSELAQIPVGVGSRVDTSSQIAQSFEIYVGLQAVVYRGLRVFLTLRDVSHIDVGEYVVPNASGGNDHQTLNVGYEGYTLGLSYRF